MLFIVFIIVMYRTVTGMVEEVSEYQYTLYHLL